MLQLNTTGLHQVMRDFYTLTNMRIVILDAEFHELLAYPQEREGFCALLRKSSDSEIACHASDQSGCLKCARSASPVIYRCHAGLTEVVVPIVDKDGVLAYAMFGQIILREKCETTKAKLKNAHQELTEEIERIPVKSDQELSAAATILQAITSYVMTNRWVVPGKSEFIRQLDRYIEEHLSQSISVNDICTAFHLGRTKLYEISEDYLGCGLAEYIRKQRIFHAQRLLLQTELLVTDIAYAVGFTDYNHFSRIFKQITGISARAYRKNRDSR